MRAQVDALCSDLVARFDGTPQFTWSSTLLAESVAQVAQVTGSTPEPLMRCVWDALAGRPLDQNVFNFCQAIGRAVLAGGFAEHPDWDLRWLLTPQSDAQAALAFWVVGVKQQLVAELPEEGPLDRAVAPFLD